MRAVLAVAAVGAASAAAPAAVSAQLPDPPMLRTVDAVWTIAGVEPNGRTLRLVYLGGGCLHGDGRAIVDESPQRIAIRIEQSESVAPHPCPSIARSHELLVTLRERVAGRPVTGASYARSLYFRVGVRFSERYVLFVIPRVIGLAPADAARVLRQQGFAATAPRSTAVGRRPAITDQLPSPGIAVGGPGGRVRVRLSTGRAPDHRAARRSGGRGLRRQDAIGLNATPSRW
jgi:hypothetical protein